MMGNATRLAFWVSLLASPVILVFIMVGVLIPDLLLVWVAWTVISAFVVRRRVAGPALIDLGMDLGQPLAKFRLRERHFRIRLLPFGGVTVNGREHPACDMVTSILLLGFLFVLRTTAFYFDGWPDLDVQPPAQSQAENSTAFRARLSRARLKVLNVSPESIAASRGLQYGDVIVSIDGSSDLGLFGSVQVLRHSKKVTLQIERSSKLQTVVLSRATNELNLYGLDIAPQLALDKSVAVIGVKLRASADKLGVKPHDLLSVDSPLPYLSQGVLLSGLKDHAYSTLVVWHTATFWERLRGLTARREFTQRSIPAARLDQGFFESLQLEDRFLQYQPTIGESLEYSFFTMLGDAVPAPWRGRSVTRQNYVHHVAGFNSYWGAVKRFTFLGFVLYFFLLLYAACVHLKTPLSGWEIVILYVTLFSTSRLGLPADNIVLAWAQVFRFAELFWRWGV